MSNHVHHKIPVSRGGIDDEWNLVELDPYTHAYEHALDFVLFEHAPHFDFRHQAWPLLPVDLQEAVLNRHSEWLSENNPMYKQEAKDKISQIRSGTQHTDEAKQKMSESRKGKPGRALSEKEKEKLSKRMTGENNPRYGKPGTLLGRQVSEETKQKISKKLTGSSWSPARRQAYENRWGTK